MLGSRTDNFGSLLSFFFFCNDCSAGTGAVDTMPTACMATTLRWLGPSMHRAREIATHELDLVVGYGERTCLETGTTSNQSARPVRGRMVCHGFAVKFVEAGRDGQSLIGDRKVPSAMRWLR